MIRFIVSLVLSVLLAFSASAVQAKVIGIIADDSGSMAGSFKLPGFGTQILAATIDGRPNRDRLFTLRLSTYYSRFGLDYTINGQPLSADNVHQLPGIDTLATRRSMESRGRHAGTVRELSGLFKGTDQTPYGPIEAMLHTLAKQTGENEDAYLIFIGDGAFTDRILPQVESDGKPLPPVMMTEERLRRSYEQHRERFNRKNSTLHVEWLLIDGLRDGSLEQIVKKQRVRDTLLSYFSENPAKSNRTVTGGESLWDALKDIIAGVTETETEAQGSFVDYGGLGSREIVITSPFSISQVISVSTGPVGEPLPRYTGGDLDQRRPERATLDASMREGDKNFNYLKMQGQVEHFRYATGLEPGEYRLSFDNPLSDKVFLLFRIESTAVLTILNEDGTEADKDPGANGGYRLFKDRKYTFVTRLADTNVQGGFVDFANVADDTSFRVRVQDKGQSTGATAAQEPLRMTRKDAESRAVAEYAASTPGAFWATAQVRIPGFAPPQSQKVSYTVYDNKVTLSLGAFEAAESCTSCAADEVQSSLVPGGAEAEIGRFTLTANSEIDGAVRLQRNDWPDFVYLTDDAGNPVPFDTDIRFPKDTPQSFRLMRKSGLAADSISADDLDLSLTVSAAGPWEGDDASLSRTLLLKAPPLILELISHDDDDTGDLPLVMTANELLASDTQAKFRLTDLVSTLDKARVNEDFRVEVNGILGPLVGARLDVSAPGSAQTTAQLYPETSFWCICLLGIGDWITGTEGRKATLYFEDRWGVQSASEDMDLHFSIGGQTFWLSCLLDLIILFLLFMFVTGLFAGLNTRRFPRNSVAEIQEGRGRRNLPRFEDLRGTNLTWLRCWFWIFVGTPHERASVEGMELVATRGGPQLQLKDGIPQWSSDHYGQPLEDVVSPSAKTHQLSWGETLTSLATRNLSVQFKRDMNETG